MSARSLVAVAAFLAGCGTRTGPVEVSSTACDALRAGEARSLAPPPESARLDDFVAVDDHVLLVWTSSIIDASGTSARRVLTRTLDVDGAPIGELHAVLEHPATEWTSASLARGHGHAGVAQWGSTGHCELVPLHDDGTAAGTPTFVSDDFCSRLVATEAGYVLTLTPTFGPDAHLVHVDVAGHPVGAPALAPTQHAVRAEESDGSFLELGGDPIAVQRLDVDGVPLSDPHTLEAPAFGASPSWAIAASDGGALLAWVDRTVVSVLRLDLDGTPRGVAQTIATSLSPGPLLVALAPLPGGDFALAWSEQRGLDAVHVARVSPDALARGAEQVVRVSGPLADPARLRIVGTTAGALVVYDGTPTSVAVTPSAFAIALRCAR